jgi:hypothetical protein
MILRASQASCEVKAAIAAYDSIVNDIRCSVQIAYCTVLANRQKLNLARENLDIAQDFAAKSAMCFPIARLAVAAGEGALSTWMAFGASNTMKSSTSEP